MGRDDAGVRVQWASWDAGQLVGWPEKALRAPSLTLPRERGGDAFASPAVHKLSAAYYRFPTSIPNFHTNHS